MSFDKFSADLLSSIKELTTSVKENTKAIEVLKDGLNNINKVDNSSATKESTFKNVKVEVLEPEKEEVQVEQAEPKKTKRASKKEDVKSDDEVVDIRVRTLNLAKKLAQESGELSESNIEFIKSISAYFDVKRLGDIGEENIGQALSWCENRIKDSSFTVPKKDDEVESLF